MSKTSTLFGISKKKSEPIEFSRFLDDSSGAWVEAKYNPTNYKNLVLISEGENFDVIAAYDTEHLESVSIYLGHWNDGIVKGEV